MVTLPCSHCTSMPQLPFLYKNTDCSSRSCYKVNFPIKQKSMILNSSSCWCQIVLSGKRDSVQSSFPKESRQLLSPPTSGSIIKHPPSLVVSAPKLTLHRTVIEIVCVKPQALGFLFSLPFFHPIFPTAFPSHFPPALVQSIPSLSAVWHSFTFNYSKGII